MQLQFAHGWVLLLLWAAAAMGAGFVWLRRGRNRRLESFMSPAMLAKLGPASSPGRFYWQAALTSAGLMLLVFAAARPQWGSEERIVFQRGRDLVVALDVSRSMLARDIHPNRLQRAKTDIQDLLRELRGDRVALIAFRGRAVQLCPLTTDYAYLAQALDDVSIESAPRGETNIGDAINKALAAFEHDRGAHRAMILVSDGEDLAAQAQDAAEKAKAAGVAIFTVGLGDPNGAKIPGAAKDQAFLSYQGKEVISRLDHNTLRKIAEITGGAYVPVGVANVKLGKLYRDHLSKITARDIEESLQTRTVERFQLFLLPGVLALIAAACLSRGRLATRGSLHDQFFRHDPPQNRARGRANNARALALVIALMACAMEAARSADTATAATNTAAPAQTARKETPASVPPGREGAAAAQALYRLGNFRGAAEAYMQAQTNSSKRLQDTCLFNAGCALYRAGDYTDAAKAFSAISGAQSALAAEADLNLGCAEFRLAGQADKMGTNCPADFKPAQLKKAGQAFQRALRARAGFEAAAASLATVTNSLPAALEQARTRALMEKHGRTPPARLADMLLEGQRGIVRDLDRAATNAEPSRIDQFEALAARQRDCADLLVPLRAALAVASGDQRQQQQANQAVGGLNEVEKTMKESWELLRNIDNSAVRSAKTAERETYPVWKALADYGQLLREDILRQSNAISATSTLLAEPSGDTQSLRDEITEAGHLTRLFTERFAQAVPEGGSGPLPGARPVSPRPGDRPELTSTNAPQISHETRTNILFLAEEAFKAQTNACRLAQPGTMPQSLPEGCRAYDLLKEIERLLPKNQDQNSEQQQDQNREQGKDDQPRDQPPPKEEPKTPENQPPEEKQKPHDKPQQDDKKDKEKLSPDELRDLLDKALNREKEHRAEKERQDYIPPSPVERDW